MRLLEYEPGNQHIGKEVTATLVGTLLKATENYCTIGTEGAVHPHRVAVKHVNYLRITPRWDDYPPGSILRVRVVGNPDPITVAVVLAKQEVVFRQVDSSRVHAASEIEKLVAAKYDPSYDWDDDGEDPF